MPSVTELPSDLSVPTLGGVNDPNLIPNIDGGIWPVGNCLPPSHNTFPSAVAGNEGGVPVTDGFLSENQTTQTLVPRSEPVILVPKRRRSVPDQPGFACLSSNEQEYNVRKEKKGRTKEECDNTKEVKELGSCFRCRLGKKRVSFCFVTYDCDMR